MALESLVWRYYVNVKQINIKRAVIWVITKTYRHQLLKVD